MCKAQRAAAAAESLGACRTARTPAERTEHPASPARELSGKWGSALPWLLLQLWTAGKHNAPVPFFKNAYCRAFGVGEGAGSTAPEIHSAAHSPNRHQAGSTKCTEPALAVRLWPPAQTLALSEALLAVQREAVGHGLPGLGEQLHSHGLPLVPFRQALLPAPLPSLLVTLLKLLPACIPQLSRTEGHKPHANPAAFIFS